MALSELLRCRSESRPLLLLCTLQRQLSKSCSMKALFNEGVNPIWSMRHNCTVQVETKPEDIFQTLWTSVILLCICSNTCKVMKCYARQSVPIPFPLSISAIWSPVSLRLVVTLTLSGSVFVWFPASGHFSVFAGYSWRWRQRCLLTPLLECLIQLSQLLMQLTPRSVGNKAWY